MSRPEQLETVEIALDRDTFMRTLVRELATSLETVVGREEAAGYISLVSQSMGRRINAEYTRRLEVSSLSRAQVADVLVDFKQRIRGDFYIIEQDDRRIVLGSRSCPFAEQVVGSDSVCMMTSNTFGTIAAENLGYAKVELVETIARGHPGCRVVVHLKPSAETDSVPGREYFGVLPDGDGGEVTE